MSNYIVPEDMLNAVLRSQAERWGFHKDDWDKVMIGQKKQTLLILQTALQWIAENPVVPSTEQQCQTLTRASSLSFNASTREIVKSVAVEWQRQMFLASDSRREKIIAILTNKVYTPEQNADLILAALGEIAK